MKIAIQTSISSVDCNNGTSRFATGKFPVNSSYCTVIKQAVELMTKRQVIVSSPSDDDIKEIAGMPSGLGAVRIHVYWWVVWNISCFFPYINFHMFQKGIPPPTSLWLCFKIGYSMIFLRFGIEQRMSCVQSPGWLMIKGGQTARLPNTWGIIMICDGKSYQLVQRNDILVLRKGSNDVGTL